MSADKNYIRIGDHILIEHNAFEIEGAGTSWDQRSVQYIFNFQARQVSTLYELHPYHDDKGVSVTMTTQNFSEIEGKEMIAAAHAKLVEMGGNPGELKLDDGKAIRKPGGKPLKID